MSGKSQEAQSVDLEEVAFQSAAKEDIAYRIEEAQRLRELQRAIAQNRRSRLRLIALFLIIGLVGASYGGYILYNKWKPRSVTSPPALAEFAFHPGEVKVMDYYTIRTARVTTPANGELDVILYDFDSNRFLKGKVILDNQAVLEGIFRGLREELQKSWIIIFAGASIEGKSSRNLILCRERVRAVYQIMRNDIDITGLGYWAIRAGEYKGRGALLTDEDEERIAERIGESGLADQRRLIVIATIPKQSQPASNFAGIMNNLAKLFYDNEFLPSDYDNSRTEPALLDSQR